MATVVESFLIEEVKELVTETDKLEEWKEKISTFNLEGQKSLCSKGKSPIPFVFMNTTMKRTYSTLCPCKESIEKYSKTAIPLQVLSLFALCKQENYFDEIEVWSDDKNPDPILVGRLNKGFDSPQYIIARWGDELRSFPELLKLAKEKAVAKFKTELNQRKVEIETNLPNVENLIEQWLNGAWVNVGGICI